MADAEDLPAVAVGVPLDRDAPEDGPPDVGHAARGPEGGVSGPRCAPHGRGFDLPVLRVVLESTPELRHERGRAVRSAAAAARLLAPFLLEVPASCRLALALVDAHARLLGVALLDGARSSACCLRPAEVFAPAVAAGAAGVYLAHRHRWDEPCGLRPGFVSTEQVWDVGREVGLAAHDHLIFDGRGRYASLREAREAWRLWRRQVKRTPRLALPAWGMDGRKLPASRSTRAPRLRAPRRPAESAAR